MILGFVELIILWLQIISYKFSSIAKQTNGTTLFDMHSDRGLSCTQYSYKKENMNWKGIWLRNSLFACSHTVKQSRDQFQSMPQSSSLRNSLWGFAASPSAQKNFCWCAICNTYLSKTTHFWTWAVALWVWFRGFRAETNVFSAPNTAWVYQDDLLLGFHQGRF